MEVVGISAMAWSCLGATVTSVAELMELGAEKLHVAAVSPYSEVQSRGLTHCCPLSVPKSLVTQGPHLL